MRFENVNGGPVSSSAPMIRERFERDGWALVQGFLTSREVDALRSASDELASKGAHLLADAEIDGARYQVQTASGRRGESAIVPGALRKITFASSASEEVALLRNDRRVLRLMESVGASWKATEAEEARSVSFASKKRRDALSAGERCRRSRSRGAGGAAGNDHGLTVQRVVGKRVRGVERVRHLRRSVVRGLAAATAGAAAQLIQPVRGIEDGMLP